MTERSADLRLTVVVLRRNYSLVICVMKVLMNQGDIITLYLRWCELLMARTSFNKRKLAAPFVQKKKHHKKPFKYAFTKRNISNESLSSQQGFERQLMLLK